MDNVLGLEALSFQEEERWAKLPDGLELGEVAAIAVDSSDRVYAFNRGPFPMIVFDRAGNFLRWWGDNLFKRPHGLHIGPDDAIYCTDEGTHSVCKCGPDGELIMRIGQPEDPAPRMSGRPFNRCTHSALSPAGDIYVTDGYGNAAVHKFSPDGTWLLSWGEPGCDKGQFNLPHNVACDADGWVYVADRENHRIQIFDGNGCYETQWNNLHRPSGLFMTRGSCPLCFVGEIAPYMAVNRDTPNLGPRISILSNGELVGRLNSRGGPGTGPGQFVSPHGIAMDSHGDLYVGEVTASAWPSLFPDQQVPSTLCSLRKLKRLSDERWTG